MDSLRGGGTKVGSGEERMWTVWGGGTMQNILQFCALELEDYIHVYMGNGISM